CTDSWGLVSWWGPKFFSDDVSTQVSFEDVLAEPASVRSFDKVWLWSHALFEVSRLWFYRIVSLLLAVPVALAAGLLFAVLSCLHICQEKVFSCVKTGLKTKRKPES
uniref:Caveolin n=1 Tax=Sinocyclocheilus rhinocerous TaxID=307959 RepID=A0A673HV19_9TELE